MKSNYIVRAIKFLNKIAPYLNKYNSVYTAVAAFNYDNRRAVKVGKGAVRYALLTSDYVVKWDYDAGNACTFGGCKEEYEIWKEVKTTEFRDLFAEITPVDVCGKTYYIMPRIDKLAIKLHNDDIYEWLSTEANDYLWDELCLHDLHNENWGLLNGSPVIIDYACVG